MTAAENNPPHLAPQLTPRGHLLALPQHDAPPLAEAFVQPLLAAYARGSGQGLLHLGSTQIGQVLLPT